MAVEIFEPGTIVNTKAIIEVLIEDDKMAPLFTLELPDRESFDIIELRVLLDGLELAKENTIKLIEILENWE